MTTTPLQLRRRFLKIVATTASLWGLGLKEAGAQSAAAKTEKAPEQLRIGYQKSAVNLVVLKQKKCARKALSQHQNYLG
jgi:sulfonate transport system substrate-binding protein